MKKPLVAVLWLMMGCSSVLRSAAEPVRVTLHPSSSDEARARNCLVVLLPGFQDTPQDFERSGFIEAARRERAECDVVVADLHFGYYRDGTVEGRLAAVIGTARLKGYESIWLVGVSLGAYGAILTARANEALVDGVVLIAPFLGLPPLARSLLDDVEQRGGLRGWYGSGAPLGNPRRHFVRPDVAWSWLAERVRDPKSGPRIVLAFGEGDRYRWKHEALASALDPADVLRAPGGHHWSTWRALWDEVLRQKPWK